MKKIEEGERIKLQKVISKIELGDFDENDIDNLLMKLRAFAGDNSIFIEISHFVAHNDVRDRGLTHEALELSYFLFKYHFTYKKDNPKFSVNNPFPIYIVKLIEYQLKKVDNQYFKDTFKFSKEEFRKYIKVYIKNSINSDEYLIDLIALDSTKNKAGFINGILYLIKFLNYPPIYKQSEILDAITDTMRRNALVFSEAKFKSQSNKIMLSILYLLHNTKYDLKEIGYGSCKICFFKKNKIEELSKEDSFREVFNNTKGEFSELILLNQVDGEFDGYPVTTTFYFLMTDLKATDWCTRNLIEKVKIIPRADFFDQETKDILGIDAEIEDGVFINTNFKLDLNF
ncbi:hypothetical protein [Runella sp.]|uniref:hypothetical protein n=1 Tax=Runella sp. TaxID=1960881 RepID=UPI003D0FA88F